MEDKRPKKSRKRHNCTPDLPSKRRLMKTLIAQEQPPTAQEQPSQASQQRAVRYTTSSELLKFFGLFLHQRCYKLKHFSSTDPISWITYIDSFLLTEGYQSKKFLSSGSVVFLYMLCRDLISPELDSTIELQASLFTCLYITYCYIGIEISYPLQPFLVRTSEMDFWDRCLSYIRLMSSKMMCINKRRQFYTMMFNELKAVGRQE